MIKAVIFDLDGVIVESENTHVEAEKQTLLKYGVQISTEELRRYTGTTAKLMFSELIKKYNLNTTFEEMFSEKEEIFFKLLEEDAKPTKGVVEFLEELKKRNIRLAVGSSSNKKLIDYVLNKLNIRHLFDCVVGAEDIVHSKPNPEIFLKAAAKLGLSPAECLVIEDAELGVEAAKRARMKCVGYKNPNSGDQDLSKADVIVDDFSKINAKEMLS
jgi:beta-phosphoglucomutase family hydrolase